MKFLDVNCKLLPKNLPLLILHFDINKTIIISDPVSNVNMEQMLNSLLSECIWGTIQPNRASSHSNMRTQSTTDCLSTVSARFLSSGYSAPCREEEKESSIPEGYKWSIDDWLLCSDVPMISAPVEGSLTFSDFLENYTFKSNMTKKDMKGMKTRFTEQGMAGGECSGSIKILQNFLRFPKNENENENENEIERGDCDNNNKVTDKVSNNDRSDKAVNANINTNMERILASGSYHIIPSFFKLISYLHQSKTDFRVIFRTFGTDIENVADEFNLYCEGRHPLFPLTDNLFTEKRHGVAAIMNAEEPSKERKESDKNNNENDNNNDYNENNKKETSHEDKEDPSRTKEERKDEGKDGIVYGHTVDRVLMDGTGWTDSRRDGTEGIDRRLFLPSSQGELKRGRDAAGEESVSVTYTNRDGVPEKVQGPSALNDVIDRWFAPKEEEISRGIIYTAAIQDDYSYWAACKESDLSGKLLLVDKSDGGGGIRNTGSIDGAIGRGDNGDDGENIDKNINDETDNNTNPLRRPIHIFFDDNIERDRAHIVDVRWSDSFLPVPFSKSENVFIKRVEPYYAVTEEDYFILALRELVEKHTSP